MAKSEIIDMLWNILMQILTKINIVIMAFLSASVGFISSITHKKRTMLQALVGAILSFIIGMTIGILASYFTNNKGVYMGLSVSSALLSESIIRYIVTNEDAVVKKIFKYINKKL